MNGIASVSDGTYDLNTIGQQVTAISYTAASQTTNIANNTQVKNLNVTGTLTGNIIGTATSVVVNPTSTAVEYDMAFIKGGQVYTQTSQPYYYNGSVDTVVMNNLKIQGGINLPSASINDSALSGNVALLNANQIFSGSVRFSNAPVMSGASINTGSILDSALSTNVALLNGTQTFISTNNFNGLSYFNNTTYLNDTPLYIRQNDQNHGICYGLGTVTPTKNVGVDGPYVFGYSGGALGTTNGGNKLALKWNTSGVVTLPYPPIMSGNSITPGTIPVNAINGTVITASSNNAFTGTNTFSTRIGTNGILDTSTISGLNLNMTGIITSSGTITSTGLIASGINSGIGYVDLQPGITDHSGYVEFKTSNGTRLGYIGYAQFNNTTQLGTGNMQIYAENGTTSIDINKLSVSGTLTVPGLSYFTNTTSVGTNYYILNNISSFMPGTYTTSTQNPFTSTNTTGFNYSYFLFTTTQTFTYTGPTILMNIALVAKGGNGGDGNIFNNGGSGGGGGSGQYNQGTFTLTNGVSYTITNSSTTTSITANGSVLFSCNAGSNGSSTSSSSGAIGGNSGNGTAGGSGGTISVAGSPGIGSSTGGSGGGGNGGGNAGTTNIGGITTSTMGDGTALTNIAVGGKGGKYTTTGATINPTYYGSGGIGGGGGPATSYPASNGIGGALLLYLNTAPILQASDTAISINKPITTTYSSYPSFTSSQIGYAISATMNTALISSGSGYNCAGGLTLGVGVWIVLGNMSFQSSTAVLGTIQTYDFGIGSSVGAVDINNDLVWGNGTGVAYTSFGNPLRYFQKSTSNTIGVTTPTTYYLTLYIEFTGATNMSPLGGYFKAIRLA